MYRPKETFPQQGSHDGSLGKPEGSFVASLGDEVTGDHESDDQLLREMVAHHK